MSSVMERVVSLVLLFQSLAFLVIVWSYYALKKKFTSSTALLLLKVNALSLAVIIVAVFTILDLVVVLNFV